MSLQGWSALVLAAGASQRFGAAKMLAPLAGAPLIRRTGQQICAAGFGETIIVTGAHHDAIADALDGLDCRIVHAQGWREGMAASLRTGIAAVSSKSAGVFVFLGDMPLVPLHLCPQLALLATGAGFAARPVVAGKPGHPACLTRAAFDDLAKLEGDSGAARLIARRGSGVAYLAVEDEGALIDIDAPCDLAVAERAWNLRATSATSESAISRGDLPNPSRPIGA